MTLRTLFVTPILLILLATLSLAGMLTSEELSGHARGKVAVAAVARMRLLVLLQNDLWTERSMSNAALAQPRPLPEAGVRFLSDIRRYTDQRLQALAALARSRKGAASLMEPALLPMSEFSMPAPPMPEPYMPEPYMIEMNAALQTARVTVNGLLANAHPANSALALNTVMTQMLAPSWALKEPMERASVDVAAASPGLSGLLAVARLAEMLRDDLSQIAGILIPRFIRKEPFSENDRRRVAVLLAKTAQLTALLENTMEISTPTRWMREDLAALRRMDEGGVRSRLLALLESDMRETHDVTGVLWPQAVMLPWTRCLTALRESIADAAEARVTEEQTARVRRLQGVIAAIGVVVIAILVSLASLRRRVVVPLMRLGGAIARIAAGDRDTPLVMTSGTREIAVMVTAVETLRQAALIADETAMRQREAARQRLAALHEALGIAQTVREPARALERGVVLLSEGIDTAISLLSPPPPSLSAAASALRLGLAEMRASTADFDAVLAAARTVKTEDWSETEIVAHVLAVQTQVDRRDAAARAFIQPSLAALRDTAPVMREAPELRALVNDQFRGIESAVAIMAAMRAAAARAVHIVRDLPLAENRVVA